VLMNLGERRSLEDIPVKPRQLAHRWILSRLQRLIGEVESALEEYHFNQHAQGLYQFIWHEYCDWYLEMIKADFYGDDPAAKGLAQSVALQVLEQMLILLHPIMPFVTEEIWQQLPHTTGTIMQARFPVARGERFDAEAERQMELIMSVVSGIRIRGEMNVPPAARVEATCLCEQDGDCALLAAQADMLCALARLERVQVARSAAVEKPRFAASTVAHEVQVYVHLRDVLDLDSESRRILKELSKVEKELVGTRQKLLNEDFLRKAPQAVIEKEKEKAERLKDKLEKLRVHLERIKALQETAGAGN
jgi:valyl-tRNA synthetase